MELYTQCKLYIRNKVKEGPSKTEEETWSLLNSSLLKHVIGLGIDDAWVSTMNAKSRAILESRTIEDKKNLEVKPSRISGNGLFAKVSLKKGTSVGVYFCGWANDSREFELPLSFDAKTLEIAIKKYNSSKVGCVMERVLYSDKDRTFVFESRLTQDVAAGEEIFQEYGVYDWIVMKYLCDAARPTERLKTAQILLLVQACIDDVGTNTAKAYGVYCQIAGKVLKQMTS